jgi:hypothetical protein
VLRLADYLVDGSAVADDQLGEELLGWLAASPRFRAFAEAGRDKIRKKLRGAAPGEPRLDLRAELRVAALLLADRRLGLAYEAYGSGRRGPDFTATHRAGRPFNIEVTRRRASGSEATIAGPVIAKLRQLPTSAANLLVVAIDGMGGAAAPDPEPVLRELRARADRRDDAPFSALGPAGAAAFRTGLQRLSAIVAWVDGGPTDGRVRAWANPGARIPLPEPALRTVVAALAAGGD